VGDRTTRAVPIAVRSPTGPGHLDGVVSIAAGRVSTCAAAGGRAWCWGENFDGRLGDGTRIDRLRPVAVRTRI
jgi:serine/threonine-protein kinase